MRITMTTQEKFALRETRRQVIWRKMDEQCTSKFLQNHNKVLRQKQYAAHFHVSSSGNGKTGMKHFSQRARPHCTHTTTTRTYTTQHCNITRRQGQRETERERQDKTKETRQDKTTPWAGHFVVVEGLSICQDSHLTGTPRACQGLPLVPKGMGGDP